MKFIIAVAGSALLSTLSLAQANIGVPPPTKAEVRVSPPAKSSKGSKPASDCRPESHINAEGALEFTDCSGKTQKEDRSKSDAPATSPSADSQTGLAPPTRAAQQDALRAKYAYQAFSYTHAQRTFEFQYWSGTIIFWVVLLIVFAGLAFSAIQFYVGLGHPLHKDPAQVDSKEPTDNSSVSEFEATLQGIKLKSSVLGLIILAMSMVFFYLYLKFVYQITNISQ